MYKFNSLTAIIVSSAFVAILASCTTARNLNYFQDLPQQTVVDLPPLEPEERVIEKGDELYISFSAKDNEAAAFFNKGGATISSGNAGAIVPTVNSGNQYNYTVADDGFLQFPVLGLIKVAGLTIDQLRINLLKSVAPYLKEPIIDAHFTTFRVTLLGEVHGPGTHTLPLQRTTIFEALAAGGDLTVNASRNDVELYRDINGKRSIITIDLRKKDVLMDEQVFQMRHNDVLYVKSRKAALTRDNTNTVASTLSIVLSLITLGIAIAKK